MNIKLAGVVGYCPGVRRAMGMALGRLARRQGEVYSHGELIHNGPALAMLEAKGLKPWRGETEGAIVIRAHGLPPAEMAALRQTALEIFDATCPRVLAVQRLVAQEAARGREVLIWGSAAHPEVRGLVGHAAGHGHVVKDAAEVAALPPWGDVALVSQTTQNVGQWPDVVAATQKRWPGALIKNTICPATVERQESVRRLAGGVDALLIVGGRSSGNTARLAALGRERGLPVFAVETPADLRPEWFQGVATLGVAAGASTSNRQVDEMVAAVRRL